MKRVLQHRKTGLYLGSGGEFSADWADALVCPNLGAALVLCASLRMNPADFVYRTIEPEFAILREVCQEKRFAA